MKGHGGVRFPIRTLQERELAVHSIEDWQNEPRNGRWLCDDAEKRGAGSTFHDRTPRWQRDGERAIRARVAWACVAHPQTEQLLTSFHDVGAGSRRAARWLAPRGNRCGPTPRPLPLTRQRTRGALSPCSAYSHTNTSSYEESLLDTPVGRRVGENRRATDPAMSAMRHSKNHSSRALVFSIRSHTACSLLAK